MSNAPTPDDPLADAPVTHDRMANAIRFLAVDAVEQAKVGHPGMPMGMADVATVLFTKFLKCDPEAPAWPDRDRFVLSAGHGSMLLRRRRTPLAGRPAEHSADDLCVDPGGGFCPAGRGDRRCGRRRRRLDP